MREQAVVQKVGNRSGMAPGRRANAGSQKPARRDRGHGNQTLLERVRWVIAYASVLIKVVLLITCFALLVVAYRSAASASFFQIRKVEVQGISRASDDDVQALVRREVARTGVWQADLNDLSAKLQQLPWIRRAVVSRVLPDGLRVRILEREPRAVVRTASGRFHWVDDEAVLLGEMNPSDQMPAFFMRGLSEGENEGSRDENVERVRQFLRLQSECEAAGVAERISEVNFSDLHDVRTQLAGNDSQIELRLGAKDLGTRLKKGLEVLDAQRDTPMGPYITYIIMDQKIPIVGHSSAARKVQNQSAAANREALSATFEVDKKPRPNTSAARR